MARASSSTVLSNRIGSRLETIENFGALPNVEQIAVTTDRTIFHLIRDHARTRAK